MYVLRSIWAEGPGRRGRDGGSLAHGNKAPKEKKKPEKANVKKWLPI